VAARKEWLQRSQQAQQAQEHKPLSKQQKVMVKKEFDKKLQAKKDERKAKPADQKNKKKKKK
jgi:hypothetical protein